MKRGCEWLVNKSQVPSLTTLQKVVSVWPGSESDHPTKGCQCLTTLQKGRLSQRAVDRIFLWKVLIHTNGLELSYIDFSIECSRLMEIYWREAFTYYFWLSEMDLNFGLRILDILNTYGSILHLYFLLCGLEISDRRKVCILHLYFLLCGLEISDRRKVYDS